VNLKKNAGVRTSPERTFSFAAVMVTADIIKHDIIVAIMLAAFTFYYSVG